MNMNYNYEILRNKVCYLWPKGFCKKHNLEYNKTLVRIIKIKTSVIPYTILTKLKCYNCGKWRRGRACPPLIKPFHKWKKHILKNYKYAYIFVAKNDGTIPWRTGEFKKPLIKHSGRYLIGCCKGTQKYLQRLMWQLWDNTNRKGEIFLSGSCDNCRKCIVDWKNLKNLGKCKLGVPIPAMEATGIDVYELYRKLGVKHQAPPVDYVTLASMWVV